ncbi:MAG: GMP/IMP nucleotidase [Methylovulum sp.]|jgi:putative hydrolase of the HAD superfamily
MINWNTINTVLLDMDGTLLDLNFDNHFWKEFVPLKYAELHCLSLAEAKNQLIPLFKRMEGQLEWYCLDFWSEKLQLDINGLKTELAGLITTLPHVVEFLERLQHTEKQVMLVTNAHPKGLALKMDKTCLQVFFHAMISSHDIGFAKEHPDFWEAFQLRYPFDKTTSVLIDDNLSVLDSARQFGIRQLISVSKPDSKLPVRNITKYPAIEDFRELMQGL